MDEKEKAKQNRKISIFTIFVWVVLVITMSFIVAQNINKANALENEEKNITIKLNFSKYFENEKILTDEVKEEEMRKYESKIMVAENLESDNFITSKYINSEEDVGIYEIQVLNDVEYYLLLNFYNDNSDKFSNYRVESDTNKIETIYTFDTISINYVTTSSMQDIYEVKLEERIDDSRDLILKVDFSEYFINENITDEDEKIKQNFMENFTNDIIGFSKDKGTISYFNWIFQSAIFDKKDGNIGIYTINTRTSESKYLLFDINRIGKIYYLENGNNKGVSIYLSHDEESILLSGIEIKSNQNEYELKLKERNSNLFSNIKWKEDKKATLEYNLEGFSAYFGKVQDYYISKNQCIVFIEKLDENFKVSDKYESDSKWLIVNEKDIINDKFIGLDELTNFSIPEEIPEYVFSKLFKKGERHCLNIDENIRYVYLKDKNILYSLVPAFEESFNESIDIELNENISRNIFRFDTKYIEFYKGSTGCGDFFQKCIKSELLSKEIKLNTEKKNNIVVNKLVNGEKGNNKYYVGLFQNDKDNVTDKIYSIDTIDGIGNIEISIEVDDKLKNYYIYEVDEKGKKVLDDDIIYNKNKVFEINNLVYKYNILSDKHLVSSVFSNSPNEIGKESGEEHYINNTLVQSQVNEDVVTISSNYVLKVNIVKYESEKGGNLIGEIEEIVEEGKKPIKIPKIKVEKNYEFDKWVVIKNGEEVEVNPSEYVIYEDTTFIAKYKKIEKEVEKVDENIPALPNTSDINIWKYIGIFVISSILIVIVIIIMVIVKKRKE